MNTLLRGPTPAERARLGDPVETTRDERGVAYERTAPCGCSYTYYEPFDRPVPGGDHTMFRQWYPCEGHGRREDDQHH